MMIFHCSKCESADVFMEENGIHVGLYCSNCGKWIKWLTKNEIRIIKRQNEKLDIKGHKHET